MKRNYYRYGKIMILIVLLTIAFSSIAYARTPSKKKVHKAYVQYIKKHYLPYYKTGKKKIEKTQYGSYSCEYYGLSAAEIDINKDGIKELILGSYTGGARGSSSLFLYRNGKVVDTHTGGTGGAYLYKKKIFFMWSNGAADNGITKVKVRKKSKGFSSTRYEEDYTDMTNGKFTVNSYAKYTINDRAVSKKKYLKSLGLPANHSRYSINLMNIEAYIG